MQNFNSNMKAYKVNSVQCSIYIRENCPRKCFWTKEKDTRVKFNPGLRANRPSNNWALVFSLNETGSFGNGIIHVVSSVRYRLYIWLIIKLRKSLRLLDTLSQKNYLLQTIIKCNNIFDTNVLSRGYPNKLKIYTNSRGWGAITSTPYSV